MEKKLIFYDNASTTRVDADILQIYNSYQTDDYFNPSAPYSASVDVKNALTKARNRILTNLNGNGSLVFLSSGTEGDNFALFGTKKQNTTRILISKCEHPAVYQSAMELRQRGFAVDFAEVDKSGKVLFESFVEKMTKNTDIVSIMHICNETGAVNDISMLVEHAKSVNPNVIFHSDGVQAVGKVPVNLRTLGVDLYTFSGHKIHAPKGIAALYIKKGVNLRPIMFGGGQENGLRSSTENVGGAVSFDDAVAKAIVGMNENQKKFLELNCRMRNFLLAVDPDIYFISNENCVPNILTFASKSVRGEVMLHALERYGIMIGTGSACSSQKAGQRVPEALRLQKQYENGIIRLSFSKYNDISECEYYENHFKQEYLTLEKYTRG